MNDYTDPMDLLRTFAKMAIDNPDIYTIFGGMQQAPKEASPYDDLKHGYELRPIEMKDKKGNSIPNDKQYSHLYRDGEQISKEIFRKGGMCNGFKDGYCTLIHYVKEEGKNEDGFSFGIHVIVDAFGKIVLCGKGITDYPSHVGGNVAHMNDTYYNLLTGEKIMYASSSSVINGANAIIVEHRYDWRNDKIPLGVYRLEKMTCKLEKIDEIKR